MKVSQAWIDALQPNALMRLWGMTLAERVMRQAVEAGIRTILVSSPTGETLLKTIRSDFWERYSNVEVRFINSRVLDEESIRIGKSGELMMILEGHCLYDERLTEKFAGLNEPAIAVDSSGSFPLLAVLNHESAKVAFADTENAAEFLKSRQASLRQINIRHMESYYRRLRSYQPVYWLNIRNDNDLDQANQYLKESVHKGTNDLIAKFIHPPFEFALTRLICNTRIRPNHVTFFNIFLAFSAIPFFYTGRFTIGLLMALTKGITDGVDGKLARLTIRTSSFGDKLDHISDMIYLNCYYVAMALYFSKGNLTAFPFVAMYWVIPTYFLDRIVRWLFIRRHHETVQDYSKIDVWFRLVQSNRNISMWSFLICYLTGYPLWGFYAIIFWTPSNFIYYGVRHLYEYNRTKERVGYLSVSPVSQTARGQRVGDN